LYDGNDDDDEENNDNEIYENKIEINNGNNDDDAENDDDGTNELPGILMYHHSIAEATAEMEATIQDQEIGRTHPRSSRGRNRRSVRGRNLRSASRRIPGEVRNPRTGDQ
jgi:hypothetical protein